MGITGITRRFRSSGDIRGGSPDRLIGAMGDRTFACPACARPLPIGQGRCGGCGSYLVSGVLVRTAFFLMLLGAILGAILGAVLAGVVIGPRLVAGATAVASAAPVSSALPAPSAAVVAPALPAGIEAGILQVATVNERLSRSAASLKSTTARRGAGAAEIAPILRKISADIRSGGQAARRLGTWVPAAALADDVAGLYAAVDTVAADGLAAPLSDDAAYVTAGRRMLSALKRLAGVDAATHAVARAAGVALPDASPGP